MFRVSGVLAHSMRSVIRRTTFSPIKHAGSSKLPVLINFSFSGASSSIRTLHSSTPVFHGHVHKPKPGEELHITFITKDGNQIEVEAAEGDNLMDIAQAHGLDVEGACGGSCACSTCHMIVDPDFYDEVPEPSDDENDMLDLAFGLTETSRLGCQVFMTPELDGVRVALPAMTRNLQNKDFH